MADGEVWAATSEAVNNNNIDEWGGSGVGYSKPVRRSAENDQFLLI